MIITTNGCFDILHYGHLRFLEIAASYGHLVVGINSDDYIRKIKGREPVHNKEQRAYNLMRVKGVREVIVFEEDTPVEFLRRHKPGVHLKSKQGYKGIEGEILKEWGGKLVLLDDIEGFSTTDILNRS